MYTSLLSPLAKRILREYPPVAFRTLSETNAIIRSPYFNSNGQQLHSSRTAPLNYMPFRIGDWHIDDVYGVYGRSIDVVISVSIDAIRLTEEDYTKVNYEGRGDDAMRYAAWLQQGLIAPPISILETERFNLDVIDGHRRVAAAKLADRPTILAWVSFAMPVNANPGAVKTGLTFEGLTHGPVAAKHQWEQNQQAMLARTAH